MKNPNTKALEYLDKSVELLAQQAKYEASLGHYQLANECTQRSYALRQAREAISGKSLSCLINDIERQTMIVTAQNRQREELDQ
ncbi:hypothetical protein JCM19241_5210 [Vibrio ishigakensis]|uniref:Uncharacterized protein n=1 Tax=Vibrio ishigakensis TaxID=1481914 RepID=A0A0B8QHC0_9VIBR|nr:hypothetical protein JCM19241_5210 [Vibrio ishigakensis]